VAACAGLPCALGENGDFSSGAARCISVRAHSHCAGHFSMAVDVNDIRAAVRRRAAHRDRIITLGLTATLLAAVLVAALQMVPS